MGKQSGERSLSPFRFRRSQTTREILYGTAVGQPTGVAPESAQDLLRQDTLGGGSPITITPVTLPRSFPSSFFHLYQSEYNDKSIRRIPSIQNVRRRWSLNRLSFRTGHHQLCQRPSLWPWPFNDSGHQCRAAGLHYSLHPNHTEGANLVEAVAEPDRCGFVNQKPASQYVIRNQHSYSPCSAVILSNESLALLSREIRRGPLAGYDFL